MNISNMELIPFPQKISPDAILSIFEEGLGVPFSIKRVFTIYATESCERGFHAHKECAQLLVCLKGECLVICDDGKERKEFNLNKASEGLLIPPTIWAEQRYETDTILMVLTDHGYDEMDYLRDYNEFLEYRKSL